MNRILSYDCHMFYVHSLTDEHMRYFQFPLLFYSAAVNTFVYVQEILYAEYSLDSPNNVSR